ncbi:MAG: hypothetical protein CPDRYMAC_4861 [uncultured Paraburkholderia sp.]|nr:MAG: hypothetical protein CPDRYDRY_4794 [uncultured Paraburkholderia sp.]CAH2938602.1 MAG: hypothetical protein CPDRYMAC_4861 [uncultured Paraburkholderia sp.]
MRAHHTLSDPWADTVKLLSGDFGFPLAAACRTGLHANSASGFSRLQDSPSGRHATTINIIARLSDHTVSIAWSDPTLGSYGDQVWQRLRARGPGVCAISRIAITRGDYVYSPRHSPLPFANAGVMILSSVIDALSPRKD